MNNKFTKFLNNLKSARLIPLTLILITIAIRLPFIFFSPVTYDEISEFQLPQANLANIITGSIPVHPPLYFLMLHYWMGLATNIYWARTMSLLFGILTVVVLWKILRYVINSGKQVAILAFILLPAHIYYSTLTRLYSLSIFLGTVLFWLSIKIHEKNSTGFYLLLILVSTLSIYTHYFFLFWLLVLNLIYFFKEKAKDCNLYLSTVLILILTLPLFISYLLLEKQNLPLGTFSVTKLITSPFIFTIALDQAFLTRLYPFSKYSLSQAHLVILGLFSLYLAVKGILSKVESKTLLFIKTLATATLALPILIATVVSIAVMPIFSLRAFTIFLASFYILLVIGLSKSSNKIRYAYVLISGIVLLSIFLSFHSSRSQSELSLTEIKAQTSTISPFVHTEVTSLLYLKYFIPEKSHYLIFKTFLSPTTQKAFNLQFISQPDLTRFDKFILIEEESFNDKEDHRQLKSYLNKDFSPATKFKEFSFQITVYNRKNSD